MKNVLALVFAVLLCITFIPSPSGVCRAEGHDFSNLTEDQLAADGYDSLTIAVIQQCKQIILDEGVRIQQRIDENTELTTDEIVSSMNEIAELMATKSKYDLTIQGAGMADDEVAQFQSDLEYLKGQIAEKAARISKEEDEKLISELAALCMQRSDIEIVLAGAGIKDNGEISELKMKLAEARGKAAGLLLNIRYSEGSTITQELIDEISNSLAYVGDVTVELDVILTHKTLQEQDQQEDELLKTGKKAAGIAEQYNKSISRTHYISEKMNDQNATCYIIRKNDPATAYGDIPAGYYEICYMGDTHLAAKIDTGILYKSGSYTIAEFEWDNEKGTVYDIITFPLCPGFKIEVTDTGDGSSEYIFLSLIEEIGL